MTTGIRIADRRGEQALRVGGRRRNRDLHAGRVHVVGLGRVVVQLRRAHAAAVRHAHDERELHAAARAPAVAPDMRDQLVEARIGERVVLHLRDRPEARHAQPDRGAEDARLRERRVDAAIGAEALAQPRRRAKDAARPADVLAHHHHGVVAAELDVQRVVDRLDHQELSQRRLRESAAALRAPPRTTRAGSRRRARRSARCRRPAPPRPPRCRRA